MIYDKDKKYLRERCR